jgi:Xaa-Pro aminopeptidase
MTKDLRFLLHAHSADAALITFLSDVRWACGFTGSNGMLIVLPETVHFLSDGRYKEQALQEVQGATIHTPGYALSTFVAEENLLGGARQVVYQADHVTVAQLEQWRELMPSVRWIPGTDLLTKKVAAKADDEVASMRRAQRVTDDVFEHLLGFIRPGLREQEVAAEIVYQHLQRGATAMSFDAIVASGARGALPHARPTDKRLASGDLVVLDFGCFVDGYASDMTRTISLGEPGDDARRVYDVVLEAQRQAIAQAHAGISTRALDEAARAVIEGAGYGDFFPHSLGHGIGLQTHEWPRVSRQVDDLLPEGTAITIEPGVYLPGRFGVRIEDIVVLRAGGCDDLTTSLKELIVL